MTIPVIVAEILGTCSVLCPSLGYFTVTKCTSGTPAGLGRARAGQGLGAGRMADQSGAQENEKLNAKGAVVHGQKSAEGQEDVQGRER